MWPGYPLPDGVKELISGFYQYVDIESPEAIEQWLDLFTPDGQVVVEAGGSQHVQGREGEHSSLPHCGLHFPLGCVLSSTTQRCAKSDSDPGRQFNIESTVSIWFTFMTRLAPNSW